MKRLLSPIAILLMLSAAHAGNPPPDLGNEAVRMVANVERLIGKDVPSDATTSQRERIDAERAAKVRAEFEAVRRTLTLSEKVDDVIPANKFTLQFADTSAATVFANAEAVAVFKVYIPAPAEPIKRNGRPAMRRTVLLTIYVAGDAADFKDWHRNQVVAIPVKVISSGGQLDGAHLKEIAMMATTIAP